MTEPSKQNSNNVTINGDGNIVGDNNTSIVSKISSTSTEFAQAFEKIYGSIAKVSDPVIREETKDLVKKIETEAQKGDKADQSSVERWLRFLADMAPDIKDVVVNTLSNPILGFSTVIQKVIAKAKE